MAYFSNGTEGIVLDDQCSRCKLGDKACPIYGVQMSYNYDAVNNDVATNILNELVDDDGNCQMLSKFHFIFSEQAEKLFS
jgi:Fe-S-cluster-containing hydrogenase component 2